MMYYHNGFGYGMGFWPLDFVLNILWFIFVIALIIMAIRLIMGRGLGQHRWRRFVGSSALDILAERYAKGEISKEEYEERRNVLRE